MAKVRTRFAPSPTGRMHVGNLRTALYAYLIAKHEDGDFLLRIEDTDQERFVEEALDIIYRTLEKTGLVHDEGPDLSLIHIFSMKKNMITSENVQKMPMPAAADGQMIGEEEKIPEGNMVKAPLVGTFYTSSAPGEQCFVKVGDTVKKGQVLGLSLIHIL